MSTSLITIKKDLLYVTRHVFIDGREGKIRPETGSIELLIEHKINTPMKQAVTPFTLLSDSLNNRFILDVDDPILFSGLLEPKNGRTIQEYYNEVVISQTKINGLWFSEDNNVPQHTLGGISIATADGPVTVENMSYTLVKYLSIAMLASSIYRPHLENYKSIKFSSTNKSSVFNFSDLVLGT